MKILIYCTITVLISILVFLSLRERTKIRTRNYMHELPDVKASPVSDALANLIGTAGGIYLTLVMLTTFLEVPVPDKVSFIGLYVEPLAGVAVILALIQPYILKFYRKIKYRL